MRKRNRNRNIHMEQATLNITWRAQNGDLLEPIPFDISDRALKKIAQEAIRSGDIPGIRSDRHVDFHDFVVDRYPATKNNQHNRIFLRPKTPFG